MTSPFNDTQRAIVNAIGRYFKVASDDQFMKLLVSGEGIDPEKMQVTDFNESPYAERLAKVFRTNLIGGATVYDAVKFFESTKGAGLEGDAASSAALAAAADKDRINSTYKFVGEPNEFEGGSENLKYPAGAVSTVSVKKAMSPTKENTSVNQNFANPSKDSPNLTAVCINPITMTPSTHSSGALALFLNCVPTTELSRAVPYLDVQVLSPLAARSDSKDKVQGFGLYQFLMGGEAVEDGSIAAGLVDGVPSDVASKNSTLLSRWETEPDNGKKASILAQQKNSFAGMEVFLSPQTLVNGNEVHTPLQDTGKRSASVIDRFRPFLTLEGFSVETVNTRGMMTYRTGALNFTLHDRSRLSEIAAFVKPDLYSLTELLITYGWSHPDGKFKDTVIDKDGKVTGMSGHSLFGIFIDSMKVSEKYKVINSSFSFDDVGQVKVQLKLSMCAGEQLNTTTISKGDGVDDALKTMKKITDAIAEQTRTLKKASSAMSAKDATPDFSVLTTSSDTTRALTIDDETRKKIAKFLRSSPKNDPTFKEIRTNLVKLYGKRPNGKTGLVAKLQATIAGEVQKRVTSTWTARKLGKDPFARTFTGKGGSRQYVNIKSNSRQYASLGLILMQFVGLPLAATNDYDEVQFVFYGFNDRAGYVRDANIAEFPINKKHFAREFEKMTKTTANIPLGKFIGFLNKTFLGSQKADVWGLKSLYQVKDGEYVLRTRARLPDLGYHMYDGVIQPPGKKVINLQENATAVANEKKKRLEDAYGEGADQSFKFPRIKMELETVKLASSKSTEANGVGGGTVLRIKLYDARATPYSCLSEIIDKSRAGAINQITKTGREAIRERKKIVEAKEEAKAESLGSESDIAEYEQAANTEAFAEFSKLLKAAVDKGLLEATPAVSVNKSEGVDPSGFPTGTSFRVKGGFPAVKKFVSDTMPTLHYGTSASGIISADVSSAQSSRLTTINIVGSSLGDGQSAQGARDTGLPLQVAPVELSLKTIGAPCATFGQHMFVDFGTGTTVDNVYIVTSVSHDISPGKFETDIKLKFDSTFGTYHNMMSTIQKTLASLTEG